MIDTSVTVLMPVYNEHWDRLAVLINDILSRGYNLVVVDDGSTPPLNAAPPNAVILRHASNLGQGAALETGMEYARQMGVKMLVHLDADGQHRIDEISKLVSPVLLGEADIAFGSRFLQSSTVELIPLRRKWQLRFSKIANLICTGVWMTDVHNGFRAMNQQAILDLQLKMPGREHASEIVYRAKRRKLKYCEVAVHVEYNQPHHVKPMSVVEMLRLFKNLLWARWKNYEVGTSPAIRSVRQQALTFAQPILPGKEPHVDKI